ncbi:MAG TPA: hypothetical protein VH092_07785, partial [Urbifossiella sp.]|nr:hypothetical protein [Urbifossiella sp.]
SKSGSKSGPKPPPKSPLTTDSDSEFELTLDDSGDAGSLGSLEAAAIEDEGKGDIFETDFEIPNLPDESGSEAVALETDTDLEESSDVALDDVDVVSEDDASGSEAVVLEDEDEAPPSSSRRRAAAAALDDEEGGSASSALAGVRGRRHDEDEDEDETVPSGAVAPPAPWGIVPALVLFPSFVLLIVGGLMGYELLHTMTGYAQPRKPASPIVRGVAKTLDLDVRDQ